MATINESQGARHAAILGIGTYRPSRVIPNAEVVDAIDSSDEWIQQRSGIKQRRWATAEETVQMMSVAASRVALERAGIDARQIDCVIVATVTHMLQTPAIATAIAHELGTDQAAAFDISAACAGFCHGVALASDVVRGGSAGYALVIGVERLSELTDIGDRGTAFIFADGAGAVVVGPSDVPGIGPVVWGSDGEQFDLIRQREDWRDVVVSERPEMPHLVMQGNAVFRWASYQMAKTGPAGPRPRRRQHRRSRRLRAPPGQHAHHRRHGAGDEAPRAGQDRPRHRRAGQHLGRVDPARPRSDDRGGRRAQRRYGPPDRLRCRSRVRRAGRHRPLNSTTRRNHPTKRRNRLMATTEEIRSDLADIVNEVAGIDADDVQLDKSFVDDLDVDSLSMVEVVVAAEEKFGVSIPDDEVKNLKTVGDAVAFIERAQA